VGSLLVRFSLAVATPRTTPFGAFNTGLSRPLSPQQQEVAHATHSLACLTIRKKEEGIRDKGSVLAYPLITDH